MKCHQCERPGIYKYNDAIILCLECHVKASDVQYRDDQIRLQQALLNAAMLNKANDDLHAVAPWGPRSSPIPVAAIAKVANKGTTLTNNIAINNSNVGVLNTGDLAKIDAAVTVTQGSDAEELGLVIKRLTESVVATEELTDETKKEVGAHRVEINDGNPKLIPSQLKIVSSFFSFFANRFFLYQNNSACPSFFPRKWRCFFPQEMQAYNLTPFSFFLSFFFSHLPANSSLYSTFTPEFSSFSCLGCCCS